MTPDLPFLDGKPKQLLIGGEWVGSLRVSGPKRQKSAAHGQEPFAMSTWHEKILVHV